MIVDGLANLGFDLGNVHTDLDHYLSQHSVHAFLLGVSMGAIKPGSN